MGTSAPAVAGRVPQAVVRTVLWMPIVEHQGAPVVYMLGVYTMALAYGLYYAVRHSRYDTLWIFGVVFCFFYLVFLLWQTYWAMLTARTAEWGTRAATAGTGASP